MYSVNFILDKDSVVLKFDTIADVRQWSERNNYVLGTPKRWMATYSIEHADGSALTASEYASLQSMDSNDLFKERQKEAIDYIANFGGIGRAFNLEDGRNHALIAQKINNIVPY